MGGWDEDPILGGGGLMNNNDPFASAQSKPAASSGPLNLNNLSLGGNSNQTMMGNSAAADPFANIMGGGG